MFLILTALFLIVNGCGGSSAQVLLDQNLLRTNYPDYATVVNMTFRSLSIIHVDHFAFAGTIALQSLDLSNNSLYTCIHDYERVKVKQLFIVY